MTKVFISHSTRDRPYVEGVLLPFLKRHEIEFWYSEENVAGGSSWEQVIRKKGLEECDWFLVILTPRSVNSQWVKAELDWALEHRRDQIIPLVVETCAIDELHLLLRNIQHVDLRPGLETAGVKLLRVLGVASAPDGQSAGASGKVGPRRQRSIDNTKNAWPDKQTMLIIGIVAGLGAMFIFFFLFCGCLGALSGV